MTSYNILYFCLLNGANIFSMSMFKNIFNLHEYLLYAFKLQKLSTGYHCLALYGESTFPLLLGNMFLTANMLPSLFGYFVKMW